MSKEDSVKDDITNLEVTRMWYKDSFGKRYSVVKYADPYGVEGRLAEEVPIYVAMAGHQPELLGTVLEELRRFRELKAVQDKRTNDSVQDNMWVLQSRLDEIDKKINRGLSQRLKRVWSRR